MTDAETQRFEEIFSDALELKSPEARRTYLDRACAGNPALRAAVDERLSSQPGVESFFNEIRFELLPAAGLPVGMQAMGRHWQENVLLRVAYNAERALERRLPERYYPVF